MSLTFHSVLRKLYTDPFIGASYQVWQVGETKLRQRLLYQARKVIGHVKVVLGVSILHLSMILDFGTVLTVWYFRTVLTVWYFRTVLCAVCPSSNYGF
jgi:hypothetical protein